MAHEQPQHEEPQADLPLDPISNVKPIPQSAPSNTPVETEFFQTGSVPPQQEQTQAGNAESRDNVEFVEPNLPTEEETVAPEDVQPMSTEEFAHDDAFQVYERMRPDQRTAIAGEFMRLFRLSGDPDAQRYDTEIHEMWPAERVAELHRYAQQRHPEIFEEVMRHPVTRASLETPGVVVRTGSEGEEKAPDVVPDIPEKHDANLLP